MWHNLTTEDKGLSNGSVKVWGAITSRFRRTCIVVLIFEIVTLNKYIGPDITINVLCLYCIEVSQE